MLPIVGVLISYLAGSIPSAYIAGKLRGVDLRKHGSGNLGATNVVRVLGAKTGAIVFIADFLKGFLPVYFLPAYTETLRPELWALVYGAAAIMGHVKPIFIASVVIALFVFWTHRANIGRLRRGEEHRFVKKEAAP